MRELNAVLNIEASSGEVKILSLLVGTEKETASIINEFPLLNDKRYLPWNGNLRQIVDAILARLKTQSGDSGAQPSNPGGSVGLRIPLPKLKKKFSQLERDKFLRDSFHTVKQYFESALVQLGRQYQEIEATFDEIHKFKFVCTIYVRGEEAKRCKIWIGGITSSESIAYYAGEFNIDSDNSLNDYLSVGDNEQVLGFKPSRMWLGSREYSEQDLLNPEEKNNDHHP